MSFDGIRVEAAAAIFNLYRPLLRLRLPEDDPRRIDRAALISIWLALMFYFFTHSDLVHYPKFSAFFWILGFHAYRWARAQAPAGQSVLE